MFSKSLLPDHEFLVNKWGNRGVIYTHGFFSQLSPDRKGENRERSNSNREMRVLPGGASEEKARQTFYAKSFCISKIYGILKFFTIELSNEEHNNSDQKEEN